MNRTTRVFAVDSSYKLFSSSKRNHTALAKAVVYVTGAGSGLGRCEICIQIFKYGISIKYTNDHILLLPPKANLEMCYVMCTCACGFKGDSTALRQEWSSDMRNSKMNNVCIRSCSGSQ